MAINTALLIAAPMLQDYFVDNANGEAMSAGVITCYQDNSRTTLKNWYYQSGTPGNYTYIALPNPLTLSAVGTITDAMGNDTIPFFYPYSETDNQTFQPYYITVVNSNGQDQFTRQNFPFVSHTTPTPAQEPTFNNYIINNRFWRNIGTLDAKDVTAQVIAPSQHDGFSFPDIQYIKSMTGATETITFTKFALGVDPLVGDITPEYYINHDCTGAQLGETQKVYQFPISLHVKTLESVQATITIQAQNVGASANNTLNLYIYQFLGSGVASPNPIFIQQITLTDAWQKFTIPFTFPSAAGATLGSGQDDALYLQVGLPLAVTCDINFTLPSIYLSADVPTNDFATYDQIDTVINSSRTGDIRTSMNTFNPFGWVAMNDGTIGDSSSNATARANADTWPLYSLLWNYGVTYDTGSTSNPLLQMFTSAGAAANYGGTAIADFNANKALALTRMMGRVMLGTVPIASLLATQQTTFTASNSGGNLLITAANNMNVFNGMPIAFSNVGGALPGGIVANNVYYVSRFNGTNTFFVSTSFTNAIAPVVIAFSSSGSGTNTVTSSLAAASEGEYGHTQSLAEVVSHTHDAPGGNNFVVQTGSAIFQGAANGGSTSGVTGGVSGHTTTNAMNVTQPGSFYNVFMKL